MFIPIKEQMELFYIALQSGRNYAVHSSNYFCLSGKRKSCRFSQMIGRNIPCHGKKVIDPDIRGQLRENRRYQLGQGTCICSLGLLQSQGNNLSLPLRSLEIRIHQSQTAVCHSLNSVQMLHACMLQLYGTNSGGINGFRNERIDISELCIRNLQVDPAQHINGLSNRLPVKSSIIVDMQIQIFLQSRYRLLVPSPEICFINFVVCTFRVNLQIRVAVHAGQLDFTCCPVHGTDHLDICQCLLRPPVPGVHSKNCHSPDTGLTAEKGPGQEADAQDNCQDQQIPDHFQPAFLSLSFSLPLLIAAAALSGLP